MKKILILFLLVFLACPVFVFAQQIDINSATLSQLDELTGIGPVYAQRIIDGRPYSSVDDLINVKGIGPTTLQKIKDQGLACVNCTTSDVEQTLEETTETEETAEEETAEIGSPPAPVVYPGGVYINEILPNPEGADETEEWLELYNSNDFDVDLSGWQIKDSTGSVKTFVMPQNTKILASAFLVFKRPETKIMLNNDGDGLILLNPKGETLDSVSFLNAPLGQSYSKSEDIWAWSATLTPGSKNIITVPVRASSKSASNKTLPETENSGKNEDMGNGLANISQSFQKDHQGKILFNFANPWWLFLLVLTVTIILAIVTYVIINKLKV